VHLAFITSEVMLSAQEAIRAARALQASERNALREAGRKKVDEYRKLKAALLNGDLIEVQTKQRTFSNGNLAAAGIPASPPAEQQEQQQQTPVGDSHDPMVDVLLSQVKSLMLDKQKLAAHCSSLQRENEQLVELVGYLSLEQQQLLDQQHQLQKVLLNSQSEELLDEDSWPMDQQHQQQHHQPLALLSHVQHGLDLHEIEMPQPASSASSMEAVYMESAEL
jgi:hypothetical protein